jgi:hypothetical protein
MVTIAIKLNIHTNVKTNISPPCLPNKREFQNFKGLEGEFFVKNSPHGFQGQRLWQDAYSVYDWATAPVRYEYAILLTV